MTCGANSPESMAGANLEIFRFGLYVFFPIAIMFHYGKPEWYDKHVLPVQQRPFTSLFVRKRSWLFCSLLQVRDRLFPPLEKTNVGSGCFCIRGLWSHVFSETPNGPPRYKERNRENEG